MNSENFLPLLVFVAYVGLMLLCWPLLSWVQLIGLTLFYWPVVILIALRE